jgi:alginate O-acetyltransferase complex protein AlgI
MLLVQVQAIRLKRVILLFSILSALTVLIYFIFQKNSSAAYTLPLGVSFYSLSLIGYMLDVYRTNQPVVKNYGKFILFSVFFPKLSSGPIEKITNLLPQLSFTGSCDAQNLVEGMRLILWGFFKKMVVADRLAIYVNHVYKNVEMYSPTALITATVFFSFQIYCDFSGYSDIAIGSARLFGINLTENFNRPYFAVSISDFWRRWHISLSNWLREYLFLPIAFYFSRKTRGNFLNAAKSDGISYLIGIMITMMVCGLWHNIKLNYLIWGGIHGFYLGMYFFVKRLKLFKFSLLSKQIRGSLNQAMVFIAVTFSWIFFRAANMDDVGVIFKSFLSGNWQKIYIGSQTHFFMGIVGIIMVLFVEKLQGEQTFNEFIKNNSCFIRWAFYISATILILMIGVLDGGQFLYADF